MDTTKKVFALGFFDGVHLGHQALLQACCALAQQVNCETAAITFEKHPHSLFAEQVPPLLSTLQDRQRLLTQYGMDHVYAYPVTKEVMGKPWETFLEELLECGAAGFVCGDDFRFGYRGEGTAQRLQEFCAQRRIPCVVVPEQTLNGKRISSTLIRSRIENGDMESATRLLGHAHVLTGTVVHGHQLGRKLGFPTANLLLPENVTVPKFGVYACYAVIDGVRYPAVTNVGTRPTVEGTGITVEPWILDFQGDLYDRQIMLEFYRFLRPEMKFPDLASLQQEILHNAEETQTYLKDREERAK
jgi:riboflavin kinase/FMN adenylyltransferase